MDHIFASYLPRYDKLARIELECAFHSYEEMSDDLRQDVKKYIKLADDDIARGLLHYNKKHYFDYTNIICNIVSSGSDEEAFKYIKPLFNALEKNGSQFLMYHFYSAREKLKKYFSYQDSSISFFYKFINSEKISLNCFKLTENEYYLIPTGIDNADDWKICRYKSKHLTDILFSILHFSLLKNLKICKCNHCQKYFMSEISRYKFCNRKSPLKGYEDKKCGDAKKAIWDKLMKQKISVNKWLSNHPLKQQQFFIDVYDIENKTRKNPTVENLEAFERYLYEDCQKYHKKYERIK